SCYIRESNISTTLAIEKLAETALWISVFINSTCCINYIPTVNIWPVKAHAQE
ncbi:11776_t:CDS:1, partial [Racocetra persica]